MDTPEETPPEETPRLKGRVCVHSGRCCRTNPGWFAPGEAEEAAELLGMTMADFARRYLIIDHLEIERSGSRARVEVFAPVKLGPDGHEVEPAGGQASDVYHLTPGACVFYQGRCGIYEVRPIECRHYSCIHPPEWNISRKEIAEMWLRRWASRAFPDGKEPAPSGSEKPSRSLLPDI